MIQCTCSPCGKPAVCDCQWGSDNLPVQTASFCDDHRDELWAKLNPLLQVNKAWVRIDNVGAIERTPQTAAA